MRGQGADPDAVGDFDPLQFVMPPISSAAPATPAAFQGGSAYGLGQRACCRRDRFAGDQLRGERAGAHIVE